MKLLTNSLEVVIKAMEVGEVPESESMEKTGKPKLRLKQYDYFLNFLF